MFEGFMMEYEFQIANNVQVQTRVRSSVWTVLGECGGFYDGLYVVLNFLLNPLAATLYENDLVRQNLLVQTLN